MASASRSKLQVRLGAGIPNALAASLRARGPHIYTAFWSSTFLNERFPLQEKKGLELLGHHFPHRLAQKRPEFALVEHGVPPFPRGPPPQTVAQDWLHHLDDLHVREITDVQRHN